VTASNRYFSGPAAQMFKTAIKMKSKNLYLDTPLEKSGIRKNPEKKPVPIQKNRISFRLQLRSTKRRYHPKFELSTFIIGSSASTSKSKNGRKYRFYEK